ncbi:MAG: YlxR family protein, partial [Chloroflexi bacterium]|nr:YlxR family protein [Chloroflexota bacterium]
MTQPRTPAQPPSGARPKHVPERSCVACRTAQPKRSLVRLVRTPAGSVEID